MYFCYNGSLLLYELRKFMLLFHYPISLVHEGGYRESRKGHLIITLKGQVRHARSWTSTCSHKEVLEWECAEITQLFAGQIKIGWCCRSIVQEVSSWRIFWNWLSIECYFRETHCSQGHRRALGDRICRDLQVVVGNNKLWDWM